MDRETACRILAIAKSCSSQLHDIVPLIRSGSSSEEEYQALARGVTLASAHVLTQILDPIVAQYPDMAPSVAGRSEGSPFVQSGELAALLAASAR